MSAGKVFAFAAAALTVSPLAVQAAPVERSSGPTAEDSELGGTLLWLVIAIAAIVAAVVLLSNDNDPVSP